MTYIYVLHLTGDRYYVGTTNDLHQRFMEHMSGNGSEWTRLYKPLSILDYEIISDEDDKTHSYFMEDVKVKKLMLKYGIDKVRGGSYSQVNLSREQIFVLEREISHANSACLRCGRKSHWSSNCFAKTHINGTVLISLADGREEEEEADYMTCQLDSRLCYWE
jgi:predicted GIY-YIG superfamily endonuclease